MSAGRHGDETKEGSVDLATTVAAVLQAQDGARDTYWQITGASLLWESNRNMILPLLDMAFWDLLGGFWLVRDGEPDSLNQSKEGLLNLLNTQSTNAVAAVGSQGQKAVDDLQQKKEDALKEIESEKRAKAYSEFVIAWMVWVGNGKVGEPPVYEG